MAAIPGGHERALADRGVRKELGAYYTPPDVVDGLLALTLDPLLDERAAVGAEAVASIRVLDPACGTGNFLVAAARRIAARLEGVGLDPDGAARAAVGCTRGVEIDAATARRCRAALREVHPDGGGRTVVRGDALLDGLIRPGAFDLVIGNPPFLNQLAASTARSRDEGVALRSRFGPAVGPYTDPAAVFLLAGLHAARPDGGVVCLVEPVSLLSGRDGRAVRTAALDRAGLRDLWVAEQAVFDADVEVCAPVLVRGGRPGAATRLFRGRSFARGPVAPAPQAASASWSGLLAALQDLPAVEVQASGLVGDIAEATADFRDQYYGLAGAVVDQAGAAPGSAPLVTSGLIDPARLLWGERPCRFNKAPFLHPRVDVGRLDAPLQDWAARRLVPKVLVATQTRVLEAVVDAVGELLPSVPVVTVSARSGDVADLWRIGALLCSPPVTLVAARRHLGAARNASALRLSASDILALPLPIDRGAWDRGAVAFREASSAAEPEAYQQALRRCAEEMLAAYGVGVASDLLRWWADRLPRSGRGASR